MVYDIEKVLRGNSYPGRGIILGISADGRNAVIVYFIMGRSVNSRNRIFAIHGNGIRTEALDPSKMTDPSLIIYSPVRVLNENTIVTNGDQTDTVYAFMAKGHGFEAGLCTREFEPDAPNYTPRISGLINNECGAYKLSIIKSADGNPASCRRFFYEYNEPIAGQGHFIHTYKGDGDPLPSFEGEPLTIALSGGVEELADRIWEALDSENKVSLFAKYIELSTGNGKGVIYNTNEHLIFSDATGSFEMGASK